MRHAMVYQLDIKLCSSGITYKSFQVLSPSVVIVWGRYRSKWKRGGKTFMRLGVGVYIPGGGRERGEREEREREKGERGGRLGRIKIAAGCKKQGQGRAYSRLVKVT
jgi:hypothetical protein